MLSQRDSQRATRHRPPRHSSPPRRLSVASADDVLTGIGVGAFLVALWPTAIAVRGPQPLVMTAMIAHVTGMLAGSGVAVLIALMSRTPALENGVGADVLARWQGRGGRIVLALALIHGWAALSVWADSRGQPVGSAARDLLGLPWLIAATVGTALLVIVAAVSIRTARRRISHERWHNIHLLVYLAVAERRHLDRRWSPPRRLPRGQSWRRSLYVATTRARQSNALYIDTTTDSDLETSLGELEQRDAIAVLTAVLHRTADTAAAHSTMASLRQDPDAGHTSIEPLGTPNTYAIADDRAQRAVSL